MSEDTSRAARLRDNLVHTSMELDKISFAIGRVDQSDVEHYVAQRIRRMHRAQSAPGVDIDTVATLKHDIGCLIEGLAGEAPPLAPAAGFGGADGQARLRLLGEIAQRIDQNFPAAGGEIVVEDRLFVLTENWHGIPAQTPVLQRETTHALCYYYAHSDDMVAAKSLAAPVPRMAAAAGSGMFNDIALEFAKGMASGAGGELGSGLINAIFPTWGKSNGDFDAMAAALREIIKKDGAKDDIEDAKANTKVFIDFFNNTYEALRDDPDYSDENLFSRLESEEEKLRYDVIKILQYKTYVSAKDLDLATEGLANFMTAVGLHFCLLQAAAMLERPDDAASTGWAKSISNYAKNTYIPYAKDIAPNIKAMRLKQISKVKEKTSNPSCHGGPAASCTTSTSYWFEDSNDGYKSDKTTKKSTASKQRDSHISEVTAEMDTMLDEQVYSVLDFWQRLVKNPVPVDHQLQGKRSIAWKAELADSFEMDGQSAGVLESREPSDMPILLTQAKKKTDGAWVEIYATYQTAGLTAIFHTYYGETLAYVDYGKCVGDGDESIADWPPYAYNKVRVWFS